MRFNPFPPVDGRYGAPMGRHGNSLSTYPGGRLHAKHCGGDGYYDRGGAYWGHSNVWAVYTDRGEWCAYIAAYSRATALAIVKEAANV